MTRFVHWNFIYSLFNFIIISLFFSLSTLCLLFVYVWKLDMCWTNSCHVLDGHTHSVCTFGPLWTKMAIKTHILCDQQSIQNESHEDQQQRAINNNSHSWENTKLHEIKKNVNWNEKIQIGGDQFEWTRGRIFIEIICAGFHWRLSSAILEPILCILKISSKNVQKFSLI